MLNLIYILIAIENISMYLPQRKTRLSCAPLVKTSVATNENIAKSQVISVKIDRQMCAL